MAVRTTSEDIDDIYTTTWAYRRKTVVDQVFTSTPLWKKIGEKDKFDTQEGGKWIEQPISYAKNETVQFFDGAGTISIARTDHLTTAYFNWKYLAGSITRYLKDDQRNRGRHAIIKAVTSDIDNLQLSLIDELETKLFGDGTGDGSNAIDGLGNIVAEDPTSGTVGQINRANWTFWRNQYRDMNAEDPSTYLRKRMQNMFNTCGKFGEGLTRFPDLIKTTKITYE